MTAYKNVSRDVLDIPQLGVHVLRDEVLETDADLSANPHLELVKKPKEVHVTANLPDEPVAFTDSVHIPNEDPADAATEGTKE